MDRVWLVLTPTHTPMPCRAAAKSPQLLFSSAMECNMPHPNPFSPADKVGLLWMRSKGLTRVRCKWMQFKNPPMLIHVIGWAVRQKRRKPASYLPNWNLVEEDVNCVEKFLNGYKNCTFVCLSFMILCDEKYTQKLVFKFNLCSEGKMTNFILLKWNNAYDLL